MRTGVTMMNLSNKQRFSDWCYDAVREVLFSPDRKAIAQELTDHYEDHVDALVASGLEQEEAEAQALAAMGDAKEVGRALNQVHKWWLGVLWLSTKAAAMLLAVLLCVNLWSGLRAQFLPVWTRTQAQLRYEEPPAWASRASIPGGTVYLAPSEAITKDSAGQSVYHADLWLETRGILPTLPWFQSVEIADQTGPLLRWSTGDDLHPGQDYQAWIRFLGGGNKPGWTRQQLEVCLQTEAPPQYLILTQPHGEEPWTIRCDWEVQP